MTREVKAADPEYNWLHAATMLDALPLDRLSEKTWMALRDGIAKLVAEEITTERERCMEHVERWEKCIEGGADEKLWEYVADGIASGEIAKETP